MRLMLSLPILLLLATSGFAQTAGPQGATGAGGSAPKPAAGDPGVAAPPGTNTRSMSTAAPKAPGRGTKTGGPVGGGPN